MRLKHGLKDAPLLGVCAFALAACSGGGSGNGVTTTTTAVYSTTILVSDGASGISAAHQDANLVNPWGIAFEPTGPVWIANNGTQTSTLYDGNGAAQALTVTFPQGQGPDGKGADADPTGVVLYTGNTDFVISNAAGSGSAEFIYDGEGGTLSGWSPRTGNATVIMYDDGAGGAVYKGLALATSSSGNRLYAADLHNNKVDVFDASFAKVTPAGTFKDPTLPAGYAPFNLALLGGKLYVAFAQQLAPDNHDNANGAGLGLVDVFDLDGNFLQHLIPTGGALNAPWGMVLAPSDFGAFSGDLLVGNFGDGRINAYDAGTGAFIGALSDSTGAAIAFPGLWGLAFGNDADNQPHNTLFFSAGINGEADGLYGRIDTRTVTTTGSSSGGTCTGYGC